MRTLILTFGLIVFMALPARSEEPSTGAAMQAIIAAQINAFLNGDYAEAYRHASPDIQALYPTVEGFIAMVSEGYRPVFSPRSFSFTRSFTTPRGPAQAVEIIGPDGGLHEAIYVFGVQEDGSLRVIAVYLSAPGSPA
ncbi:MAG: DUF4864 domain-containing protein [Hyphomicrobiaceae bacterium]|nr:DUF4864 domain-containing protein [Hyphomicrobiaceae bacterium]